MNKRKGFTLIELLVVIAIIALLMGILMPALARVRKQARLTACLARLKQWGLAFNLYCQDNDGYFFSGEVQGGTGSVMFTYNGVSRTKDAGSGGFWRMAMYKYIRDTKMWVCPQAVNPPPNNQTIPTNNWSYTAWITPDGDVGSYGLNGWVLNIRACKVVQNRSGIWGRPDKVGNGPSRYWGQPISQYSNQTPIFTGGWWVDFWPLDVDQPPTTADGPRDIVGSNEMQRCCVDRHNGFVGSAFADWTVRKVGLKELWTLKWHRTYNTRGPWTKAAGDPAWPPWMSGYKDY